MDFVKNRKLNIYRIFTKLIAAKNQITSIGTIRLQHTSSHKKTCPDFVTWTRNPSIYSKDYWESKVIASSMTYYPHLKSMWNFIPIPFSFTHHGTIEGHFPPDDDDDELFCGMVDRRKAFSLIFSRDHCQRSSPSRISDTPRAGFEPAQNLSSGFDEWSCSVVITTTPRRPFPSFPTI